MADAYSIILPNPPNVPAPITVRIVAMRDDAKALSREELEALAAAYPPPDAVSRAHVEIAIKHARSRPPESVGSNTRAKPATKARAKSTRKPATKTAPKRKAAKRPTRG